MVAKPAVRTEVRQNTSGGSRRAALLGAASALLGAGTAQAGAAPGALPQDPTVAGGAATFARSGQTLTVDQSTSRAVIDWRSFDIGAGAQATFNQPSASAIAVNRVNAGTDPTHIDGALRANGQVWVLNPNGVMFGKGAVVNVAGIVASTANIDAGRFMAGDNRLNFTGADRGFVANDGAITVAESGLAAFVAPSVRNSGAINARVGKVTLAAGSTFTLDLAGDRLVEIGLGAGHAVVDQSGSIVDEGGVVTLSARSAGQVVDSVINMSGVVSTASARMAGGQIVLEGDTASVTGAADASGAAGGRITLAANTIRVAPEANLRADSVANGDGGTITAVAAVRGDYAGAYSARGGPSGGAGGQIETSGKVVHIADGVSVDTRAPAGAMGGWTIDPDNLTIVASGAGTVSGGVNSEDATISADTVVQALNTSSVNLQANTSISVNAAIDSSAQANANTLTFKDQNADGQLTINLNAPITLGSSQHLAGMANLVNLTDSGLIQNAIDVARTGGSTVNVGPGNYEPGSTINKSNLTLLGTPGLSEIDVNPGSAQVNAITINANGATVSGFHIVGEITGSYVDYGFGSGISRGVFAPNGVTGFTISNNTIQNVRNGILIDGRNGVGNTVTGNTIDNTKSAISVQYTAGTGINISGNVQGAFGNEWGENLHLNGTFNGTTIVANSAADAPLGVQTALLAAKAANAGWSIQDQGYATSNRTDVFVAVSGSTANQGSPRAKLATIQAGISAVVTGGTVNVANGTYVIPNSAPYLGITKSLSLVGQSQAETIIDAHAASQYGLRVTADNVSLSNFTLLGVSGAGASYGIKVENNTDPSPDARIYNLSISNVTSHGARKAQLDLNGVVGATIDHFTADGTSNGFGSGSQAGAGIAISDSANVTITNSSTHDNAWAGLALYQTNTARNQQVTGITVDATNFAEAVPVYAEDSSASKNFGALSIAGLPYVVHSPTDPNDVYTWFTKTPQGAVDLAILKGATAATVEGYSGSGLAGNNLFTVGVSSVTPSQTMSIKAALDAALTGATVTVNDGTYVIPGGGTSYLGIDKSLTLSGTSQSGTIIDARGATAYGLRVQADNVTLGKFTLLGSTATGGYGVKVEPLNLLDPNARVGRFLIHDVTIDGAAKNALDLNGALNATIDNVTAKNAIAGNGIALIDSANVAITNSTTANNAWGGLRIEQKNASFNQQTDAITVAASNGFNEAAPVYLEDDSASKDFGAVNVAGFGYAVKAPDVPTDVYTWLQKTQQGAIDFAAAKSASVGTVQTYSGSGLGDNLYTVGVSTGGQALSIGAAANAAASGATINVLSGSYAGNVAANTRTNFNFGTVSLGGAFRLGAGAAGSALSGNLSASSIALNGSVVLSGATTLNTSAANGSIVTASIEGVTAGGQALTLLSGTGAISLGSLGAATRLGAVSDGGLTTLTGGTYRADSLSFGKLTLAAAAALDTSATGGAISTGAVDGLSAGGQSLAVNAGEGQTTLGALGSTTRLGAVQISAGRANLGGGITAASIALGGPATLLGSLALDTSATGGAISTGAIDGSTAGGQALALKAGSGQTTLGALGSTTRLGAVQISAGRANLGGDITAASIALGGRSTLLGSLALDTSATGGGITTGAIDSSSIGGQALALKAGGGSISLGSVGASARLGAVQASSPTTLTGDTYNAASLAFDGDVVLTASQTTVTTAPTAGNITVAGSLLGSSDAGQSLALVAGAGDISLQNVGAKAVRLNNLSVSGDDFGAQTVDLAGNFTAKLTGNQVFSSHTLNAGGVVDSTVGGNASGPVNAGGTVSLAVGGDLTGAIAGTDISLNAGTLTNAVVNASQSAAVVAETVTGSSVAAAQNVNMTATTMNASSVSASQSASVNAGAMAGSTVAAIQNVNVNAGSVTNSTLSSTQTVTLAANQVQGSTFSASQAVNVSANSVSGSSLTAPKVSANAASFNSTVSASGSATITGGDISGSFSGGAFKIAGTGAVNANVTATSLSVDTPKGTVTGSWQSLDTGASGRGVSVNNQPVNVQGSGVNANQIVVENFTLPTGSVVTKTGEIILPQGQMIGLLSPGGASGAPKLIQVQTVQQLGSLLSEGYTAIVIDLSGHEKGSNDDQAVKVSQK